jgi:hypothetical protein
MADNQMVKIEFDFDLGNVPASAKKFAEYLKGIEVSSKEAQAQLNTLGKEIDKTADKMSKTGDSIKKSNQQWTNLALVIQDLPYGFRGIQNNLPALVGGLANMTGVLYLAASAAIALYTAYDMGIFKSKAATEAAKARTEELKKEKDAIDSIYRSTANETVEVSSLIAVLKSETETRNRKFSALEQLKKINPEIFNGLSLEKNAVIGIDDAYKNYIASLSTIIAVKIKQAELESIIEKRLKAEGVTLSQEEKDLQATGKALNATRIAKETDLQQRREIVAQQIKEAKSQVVINGLKKQEADILTQLQSLSTGIKVTTSKDGSEKDRSNAIKAANEAETKAYLNSLDERGKKEYQAGLVLADNLAKMKAAGFSDSTTYYTEYRNSIDKIAKEYDDKEYKRSQDSINANIAAETKFHDDSERAWDALKKREADNQAKYAKRQTNDIETELSVQEKLNKGSLIRRIDYTKQALAKVAVLAAMTFDPNTIGIYLDAFDKLNAKLKGYGDQWNVTAKSINDSIQNFVISSFTLMGDSLGKALAGENVDIFNAFAMLIADALTNIGTSLISYATMVGLAMTLFADPLTWPIALAAGIAAVAAGAFLKAKLSKKQNKTGATAFANGGIVSGPTMGLIGEYPGAKSNPEIVAPLDKLKDMLGGGGNGQFVLRGSDLILALNRSESSLNLRRGA